MPNSINIRLSPKPSPPRPCPLCSQPRGEAHGVRMSNRQRTIRYVCGACEHSWEETGPYSEPMFLLSE